MRLKKLKYKLKAAFAITYIIGLFLSIMYVMDFLFNNKFI